MNLEIKGQIEELTAIRKEFEVQKAELNFLKAKKLKIETLMRRDQIEIANSLGQEVGQAVKVTNMCQIYQGEWKSHHNKGSGMAPSNQSLKKQYICDIHWYGKYPLDLYCLTDLVPICVKCYTDDHYRRNCTVCSIQKLKEVE